jgi:hypothetical protein
MFFEAFDCVDSQHFSGLDSGAVGNPQKKRKISEGPKLLKSNFQKSYTNGDGVPRSHLEIRNPFDTPIISSPESKKMKQKSIPQSASKNMYRPVIVGNEVIPKKVGSKQENGHDDLDDGEEKDLDDLDGPLGSDDDDDLSEPEEVEDTLICQFTKINRTKDLFSIRLNCGILKINGKEYCFSNAEAGTAGW